jgi:hypothetical protein
MAKVYTVDLWELPEAEAWEWKLYRGGGQTKLAQGVAHDIEGALAEAGTQLLVEHRAEG